MMTFPAIRIEGGLLGPDTVEQLLRGELPGQKPADFGLDGRRNLLDEIAAAFADCRKYWEAFQHRLGRLPEGDPATSVTRDAWAIPFFSLLGIEARYTPRAREVDGMSFPISHRMGEAEDAPPLHIVGARQGLDRAPASGRPRLSPHALMQEYLNRTEHLWGVVTNGLTLRLLRNSAFIRQQAYIEFDLRTMLEEQRFNDFAALYRLLHRTRFPRGVADAADCLLEQYYQLSIQQGGRVRERLREGVEEAIVRLANGFLSHPANEAKWRMANGEGAKGEGPLPAQDFYRQLLRLVYRFLFLLVAEERGLMNPNGAGGAAPDRAGDAAGGAGAAALHGMGAAALHGTGAAALHGTGAAALRPYDYYGVSRLRRLCERRAAYTDDTDLWRSLCALWVTLTREDMAALLGVPPLNGALFAPQDLDGALITNRDLLGAFWHLAFYQEGNAPPRRVNYAALDTEELGSVYESLLDYHPVIEANGEWQTARGKWRFVLAPGSERKSTGSYYTPPALVAELINSALMPVIQERLAAAERMANEVGRMANGEMAVREWRKVPKPIQERFIHDVFPRLSRSGSVGAGDVDRATGVSADAGVSTGGAVWDDQPDAPGSGLDPGQHRRGLGPALHGGVHPVSAPSERQPGRTGDAAAPEQPGEPVPSPDRPSAVGGVTDRRQATHQPRAQPPTEKELALAWQSTPSSIRYSLFAEHALLSIKVLDPACGSGHFLLAAARRLGKELARVRSGEDEPAPERLREAIRDVIAHCIYGVDKNPLAVELARVALWLESHAPDRPLTFLDHRIKCGDSLVGVLDLAVLEAGLPDEAFEPVGGNDRKLAAGLKKRNRQERSGQLYMFNAGDALDLAPLAAAAARLAAIPDDTPANVRRKQAAYDALLADPRRKRLKDACDLWTAAFFQALTPLPLSQRGERGEGVGGSEERAITTDAVRRALAGDLGNPQLVARAQAVADAQRFFHWPLEFPEVFERQAADGEWRIANGEPSTIPHSPSTIRPSPPTAPGFDVILGNPPWERIKLQKEEFFAGRDAEIAGAPNAAARERLIAALPETNPALWQAYQDALHAAESASRFLRSSGAYPLTGRGDINTYSVFAERIRGLLGARGRAGIIVPTGIATDATNQFFFADLMEAGQLVSLFDFENREKLFPAVDSRMKFCLLTLAGERMANGEAADGEGRMANGRMADGESSPATFAFFATRVEHLRDPRRVFGLTAAEIARINPNTRTLPVFRTRQDAALTSAIYARVPVLVNEGVAGGEAAGGEEVDGEWRMVDGSPFSIPHSPFAIRHSPFAIRHSPFANPNPWGVRFLRMFDMSNDSHLFRTRAKLEAEGYRLVGNAYVQGDPATPSAVRYLPLYEAKMIWHYDHRYGTYQGVHDRSSTQLPTPDAAQHADPRFLVQPRYWVPAEEVEARLGDWRRGWLLGWRDVARSTDERTVVASIVPCVGYGDKFLLMLPQHKALIVAALISCMDCIVFDYISRQKIGGVSLKYFIMKQLPVLPPNAYSPEDLRFIVPRALELIYTAWDIKPFADDVWQDAANSELGGALQAAIRAQWEANRAATGGVAPAPPDWLPLYGIDPAAPCPLPPFRWDEGRRAVLRAELDAYYARLYGLTRKQLRYILDPADLTARELDDLLDPWEEVADPLDAAGYAARADASDFPGETFRVLKTKELRQYGEYRTRRLVLEAWARLAHRATDD
jgi:hypothetical protein